MRSFSQIRAAVDAGLEHHWRRIVRLRSLSQISAALDSRRKRHWRRIVRSLTWGLPKRENDEPGAHWFVRCQRLRVIDARDPDPLVASGTSAKVDVYIPVGPKDVNIVQWCLEGLQRNLRNPVGRIILVAPSVVSPDLRHLSVSVEVIDEEDVLDEATRAMLTRELGPRAGWLIQQFLNLSIPEVTDAKAVLVIDADTILLQPRLFRSDQTILFLAAPEYHVAYFRALGNLWRRPTELPPVSYTAHHMCFLRDELVEMRSTIERTSGCDWKEAILAAYDRKTGSGFSEYELYGQWRMSTHPEICVVRGMRNVALPRSLLSSFPEVKQRMSERIFSISCHHYL